MNDVELSLTLLRLGLPKKTQTFSFFRIDDKHVTDFRTQLLHLLPLITSSTDATGHRERIARHKRNKDAGLLSITGVNVAFSSRGLQKVSSNLRVKKYK